MRFLQPAIIAIFLLFNFTLLIDAQDDNRISKTWKVERYDITAGLPQSETDRNMTVKAVLGLKNISGAVADTLTLRINQNASISSVKINDQTADFSKREEKVGNGILQRVIIRLSGIQPGAAFAATVDYQLNVKENLGLSAISPVGSHFLPLSFWYPTPNSWFFSRGGDFAPFRLNVTVPNGLTLISSGTANGNTFEQKLNGQPFFIAESWDVVNSNNITVYLPKGAGAEEKARAEELAAFTAEAKTFAESLLGPAPDVPIRVVAVKRGAGFSGGGTVFVEDSLFRRQKMDSQTALSVADAVAKIWLGNAVLVDNDGFGVIREGLSRYIATQFLEKKYGKEIADIERLRQRTAYASVAKRDAPLKVASPLDDYYYASVANKGAMIWRLLAKKVGQEDLFAVVREQIKDGATDLAGMREALNSQKALLDYEIDEVLDMNLMVGLPQTTGGATKSALRNTGGIDVTVDVVATTSTGERMKKEVTIPAKGFGEVSFETPGKIIKTEIDAENLYPQTEYTDDVAPRDLEESDPILTVKRAFDKQDFAAAEKNARTILQSRPRFDDVRILLGRSLLAQGKVTEADREFRAVLEEKLPTSRSLAWANVGLGELALRTGQKAQAVKYFEEAIKDDAEYGATLAARQGRNKAEGPAAADESVKAFFANFDKAAVSGRKAELDALIIQGEVPRFAGGVAGAQEWLTKILHVDKIDANTLLVEADLNIRLLSKEEESGLAVFQISKVGSNWRLSGVEMFEVR
ncbi:MAG: hypothetical protein R2747_24460 [Pyrinomonadaceae bacterium]